MPERRTAENLKGFGGSYAGQLEDDPGVSWQKHSHLTPENQVQIRRHAKAAFDAAPMSGSS